ncbi:uncharacterized [Tachysurus ichikawai]
MEKLVDQSEEAGKRTAVMLNWRTILMKQVKSWINWCTSLRNLGKRITLEITLQTRGEADSVALLHAAMLSLFYVNNSLQQSLSCQLSPGLSPALQAALAAALLA